MTFRRRPRPRRLTRPPRLRRPSRPRPPRRCSEWKRPKSLARLPSSSRRSRCPRTFRGRKRRSYPSCPRTGPHGRPRFASCTRRCRRCRKSRPRCRGRADSPTRWPTCSTLPPATARRCARRPPTWKRPRAISSQAWAYPNPTVAYQAQPSSDGSTPGFQGFLLDQTIKTAGKLKLQAAAQEKALENAELALKRARSDLATQVRNAYYALLVAKETVRVNKALARFTDEVYLFQEDLLEKGGQAAPYEPAALRAQAYTARLAYKQALQTYIYSWKQLVAAVGLRSCRSARWPAASTPSSPTTTTTRCWPTSCATTPTCSPPTTASTRPATTSSSPRSRPSFPTSTCKWAS